MALDAAVQRLSATPWCRNIISSERWVPANTASRVPKPTTEDSLFADTLQTPRTIRTMLTLVPTKELTAADGFSDMVYGEVRTIAELGDGVNGHPRVAHGGFVTTLLDEVMGVLITLNSDAMIRKKVESGLPGPHQPMTCFTAYLNTNYKKPLPTPGVVLCTATLDRVVRNKIYVRATIEDGNGTVFTTGEGMFVSVSVEKRDGKL